MTRGRTRDTAHLIAESLNDVRSVKYAELPALVILGAATGIYAHATLAPLGLSAVVMTSALLFQAVKLPGAAYLIGLGLLTLAPQVLGAGGFGIGPVLILASVHVAAMGCWTAAWTALLRGGRRWTGSPGFGRLVGRVGGVVLVGLGVRTAVS